MKKIYNKIVEVMIEGKTDGFFDTSLFNDFHYIDEAETEPRVITYPTYEALFDDVKNGKVRGVKVDCTLFRNRLYLSFFNADEIEQINLFPKDFQNVIVKTTYRPVRNYTLESLYKQLPADDFLDYCADHCENFLEKICKKG